MVFIEPANPEVGRDAFQFPCLEGLEQLAIRPASPGHVDAKEGDGFLVFGGGGSAADHAAVGPLHE